jgi:stage V sporulation protein G
MEINLSEIQIMPCKPRSGLLAFTSFVLNNSFYIGDVAIYSRLNGDGFRLAYPTKVLTNGLKIQCFHPIRHDVAQLIEEQVIKAFLELTEKAMMMKGKSSNGYSREE